MKEFYYPMFNSILQINCIRLPLSLKTTAMLEQIKEQQQLIQAQLANTILTTTSGEGLIKVTMSADRRVRSIEIKAEALNPDNKDLIEDHLLLAMNEAIGLCTDKEKEIVQSMMSKMMPGGLGGLKSMLGF